ncbi:hypothetical protein BLL42_28250 (plasmid) [Pseudomonas frederiksbergensis]|uniref:HTH deoR-type domain-containing protein n=1 Tax=Pseudomonas frederiksbergensis TaxID=104087 RepID=A0A1J0ETY4_9PSED|nr:DeoR family transcriptional regulator [Pseudomonas frederiksbergensis]APC19605.1 hypothetical protein BLL42_28250 [Pseudomonas frederiksbergensis]
MTTLDEQLEKAFIIASFTANRFLVDHMRRASHELNLDLESLIILGVLAHANISTSIIPGQSYKKQMPISINPIRTSDISAICNIPKETTRRKLKKLKDRGIINRNHEGLWLINPIGIDEKTRLFTKEMIKRLLQTAKNIEAILASQ